MEPKYRIRVQAIATADDDGSHAADITTSDLKTKFEFVNTVFAAANIEFVFNEQDDFFRMKSTVHNRNFTMFDPPNIDGDKWDLARVQHQESPGVRLRDFPATSEPANPNSLAEINRRKATLAH